MIVREAVIAINDEPITSAYSAIAALIAQPVKDEPIMLRVLNANFRLGTPANAVALATFAANAKASAVLRKEAIDLLALWPAPPARDRIVGVFRPLADKTRPASHAADALTPILDTVFVSTTPESIQISAIEALTKLKHPSAHRSLNLVVRDAEQSTDVRVSALKALDKLNDADLGATAALVAASEVAELRLAALPVLSRLSPAASIANLARLLEVGTPKEQQAAFRALGAAKDPAADNLLVAQLTQLAAGKIAPAAQLDLLEAAALHPDPRIKHALADRDTTLAKDSDPLAPFRVCLEGGNGEGSRKTFMSNPVIQCIRCHSVGNITGGEAGPNLAGIGLRSTREYILESIIKPSAKIAPGFEIVTVTRKNGDVVVGTLIQRDDKAVRIRTSENEVEIPATDLKEVVSAPSAMPEVAAFVLTKSEIRDLVEGLASLKDPINPRNPKPLRALRAPRE